MLNDTQFPSPRVAITEDGQLTSRSWFRFFSNLFNFIGLSDGAVPVISGGTGIVSYDSGDLIYAPSANTLSRLAAPGAGNVCYLGTDGTNMPQWIQVAYGAFEDTTTQTATLNTATAITFNTITYDVSVSRGTPTSRIILANAGLYNIQFSIQLNNTNTAVDDIVVWLKVNGSNVANTASWITVPSKHGSDNGSAILALNLFNQFNANDYFELFWLTKTGTSTIQTVASGAAYPASPGAILTVNQII